MRIKGKVNSEWRDKESDEKEDRRDGIKREGVVKIRCNDDGTE